ncbi:Nitrogen assimilation transcription factor nit-4 [Pleurostoma richardsiae]|uniref:Nitrogen assimilation transcription factor nit-4 n=1 Tax=Pleurostoma richardsiae TaxID=41990 RepID=A0AA38RKC8_9PEZI|nr:Nitrogen assimilation transcription factor nit-4 [Pleurostoma richardsiae]
MPSSSASSRRQSEPSHAGSQNDSKHGKRTNVVAQACRFCRQNKAKCDGMRPRCATCVDKGRPCGYEGEAGQSRQAAMKSRLDTLERLFAQLQTRPTDEAGHLLQRIRSTEDLASLVESRSYRTGSDPYMDSQPSSQPSIAYASGTLDLNFESETRKRSLKEEEMLGYSHPPSLEASPAEMRPMMQPSDLISPEASSLLGIGLPDPSVVTMAIDSFLNSSGKLFHVFSREQVARYYARVSHGKQVQVDKAAVCCISAVAAVGLTYRHGPDEVAVQKDLYDIARHYYDDIMQAHPLDAIKISTLLAVYNIMGKATVAFPYVEVGLGIAKRYGLDKRLRDPSIQAEDWFDYRRTWRTLMFLSSWLSFTLGYISGNDVISGRVLLSEMNVDDSSDISDIIQTEMVKISLLKATILRMNLAFKDLSVLTMDSIVEDLRDWRRRLPTSLHLENLVISDIPENSRTSVYHLHLLYLGAFMLLYRRLSSQFLRSHGRQENRDLLWPPSEHVARHAEEGVLAAKDTARLLRLLLTQNMIFKRCWLVIFQAYTACTVVLYSAAQKQLHFFLRAEWEEDLDSARICLSVLEFCGTLDPVAQRFYAVLSRLLQEVAQYQPHHLVTQGYVFAGDALQAIWRPRK